MTHQKSKMHPPSFYAGVLSALAIIAVFDEGVIFDEIVKAIGEADLVKVARRDGTMRWSGLSKYGYGKKIAAAAVRAAGGAGGDA